MDCKRTVDSATAPLVLLVGAVTRYCPYIVPVPSMGKPTRRSGSTPMKGETSLFILGLIDPLLLVARWLTLG
jgi:hypothetical protein